MTCALSPLSQFRKYLSEGAARLRRFRVAALDREVELKFEFHSDLLEFFALGVVCR